MLNLLLNAEQALGAVRRPGTVRLRTALAEEPDSVMFEISDDGSGVPPQLASRIFEPFFTTKVSGEGTGLGLSVSLGIAAAHGGTLMLLPSTRGARFALTLPMASIPALDTREAALTV